jgi:predicted nucleic acid-binding protein
VCVGEGRARKEYGSSRASARKSVARKESAKSSRKQTNSKMLLLDTSVWIDLFADQRTETVNLVLRREASDCVALAETNYFEVMQGVRAGATEQKIRTILSQQQILRPLQGLETYDQAAALYRAARRSGLTVRTAIDCLIAQIAVEHEALRVHNDRDFFTLAKVEPRLLLFPSKGFQ